MAVSLDGLKEYVGITDTESNLDTVLTDCLVDAVALINNYVGSAVVPESIEDRCALIVAQDLFERRNAPNGIINAQFQSFDGQQSPARIARDPMAGVYPILSKWVLPW